MAKLWQHQERMVQFMSGREAGLVHAGMRTGKTLATLEWIRRSEFDRVLVLTKKKIIDVWSEESAKFGYDGLLVVSLGYKSVRASVEDLDFFIDQQETTPYQLVVVMNYDRVWRQPLFDSLQDAGFDAMVLDESHAVKANNGSISNAVYELSKIIPRRMLLTGTPMPNGPMDMYGQLRVIDPELVRVHPVRKGFGVYREFFCELEPVRGAPAGIVEIVGYKNVPEFQRRMASVTLQIKTEDVFDMPDVMHIERKMSLSPSAMKLYKTLKKESIVEVGDGVVTTDNVLVKATRLHQITGGFATLGRMSAERSLVEQVDTEKLATLLDIVDGFAPDEPFIVFAKYTAEISAISNMFNHEGFKTSVLSGTINELPDWKEGKTQALVVQIDTGAEGISMARADYAIYYSLGYSLGKYEQSLFRIIDGNKANKKVAYYHIIARGTIDETIYEALKNKEDVNAAILDSLGEPTHADFILQ